ncbi:uncharacterized protein LOC127284301 [Leptopilina boulardi]|uniref:uncharacterized protein LOC127284301 n=1 Tax=Leptopilina boulardi TaxID=63433 RepID=UPI0021F55A6E|nr:uncharacterized protein LOC127284301 [Leptopilina boulardi]
MKNHFTPLKSIENSSAQTVRSDIANQDLSLLAEPNGNETGDGKNSTSESSNEIVDQHTNDALNIEAGPSDAVENGGVKQKAGPSNAVQNGGVQQKAGPSNTVENWVVSASVAPKRGQKISRFEDRQEDIERLEMDEKDVLLFTKINTIGVMVERIANRESNGQPSNDVPLNLFRFYGEPGEEHQFPVKSIEELMNLETKLVSKRFRKDLISSLERLRALTNLSLTVKRMLSILLTDEVGRKYSFDGRTKKRSFKDLRIKTIVIDTTLKLLNNEKDSSIEK